VLYLHAKTVVADAGRPGEQMFAGSGNFSVASLRYNRELGVRTTNNQVISAVARVLGDDRPGGTSFSWPALTAAWPALNIPAGPLVTYAGLRHTVLA
jgi:phosphatidylserine/phosphatidylglycerophosphate/cardiolipin synthase-like enzyme